MILELEHGKESQTADKAQFNIPANAFQGEENTHPDQNNVI